MQLVGQLSNPSGQLIRVLSAFPAGVSSRWSGPLQTSLKAKRLGNGVIKRAVLRALADGERRKLAEVVEAVGDLTGQEVSVESVSWCLRMGSRKEQPLFDRPARGYYQLRSQAYSGKTRTIPKKTG